MSSIIAEHMEILDEPAVRVLLIHFNNLALGVLDANKKQYGWGKKN